jgi:ribosome-binding protein aMBF1 (putative translation factor)
MRIRIESKKAGSMKTSKSNVLDTLVSQFDKHEYEKVKIRMSIATQIADALKEKGMSQKDFAEQLREKPSEISKWLTGTHNFTIDTLTEIQFVLGIKLINAESLSCNFSLPAGLFPEKITERLLID